MSLTAKPRTAREVFAGRTIASFGEQKLNEFLRELQRLADGDKSRKAQMNAGSMAARKIFGSAEIFSVLAAGLKREDDRSPGPIFCIGEGAKSRVREKLHSR